MNDHAKSLLLKIGITIILIVFTLYAFVINPGGTDSFVTENLYEAVHPLEWNDILGLLVFYGSALFLAGWFKPVMNPINSKKWNILTFAGVVVGVILIWI